MATKKCSASINPFMYIIPVFVHLKDQLIGFGSPYRNEKHLWLTDVSEKQNLNLDFVLYENSKK